MILCINYLQNFTLILAIGKANKSSIFVFMKANPFTRNPDQLLIPEGIYRELYTPIAGRIKSPSLNKYLQFAKIALSADATVVYKDHAGNQTTEALKAGPQSSLFSEVISVSVGTVTIIHDGIIWSCDPSAKDMTIDFPSY